MKSKTQELIDWMVNRLTDLRSGNYDYFLVGALLGIVLVTIGDFWWALVVVLLLGLVL